MNIRCISPTVLHNVVQGEFKPPTVIQWAPPGTSTISATLGGAARKVTVTTEPNDAMALDAQLQTLLAESKAGQRSRPFIDFSHEGKEAAAIPVRFFWEDGIRLELEWTSAGREAIEGRTYSYFSPEVILDDSGRPKKLPSPGAIGALVNTPAFQKIERLAAANNDGVPTMSALLKAAVAKGFVPTGVGDDEAAAEHFLKKVEAANKAEAENATLKAQIGVFQREREEAEEKRKGEAESEVDGWIKAGHVLPEARELVIGNLLSNPETTRAQFKREKPAPRGEKPIKAATTFAYGEVSEEEDRIEAETNWKRKRVLRAAWYDREMPKHLKAGNTIGAGLTVATVARDAAIAVLHGKLAPLRAFSNNLSLVGIQPMAPVVVNVADFPLGSVIGVNPATDAGVPITDFEQSTVTYTPKTVTPVQLSAPWGLANADIQNGIQMLDAAESAANALGNKVQDQITMRWITANYPNAAIAVKASEWALKGPKTTFGKMVSASRHHLILNRALYSEIAYINKQSFVLTGAEQGAQAYQFDGIWFLDRIQSVAAAAGAQGFALDPRAMIVAAGPPILHPSAQGTVQSSNIAIEDLGLAVQSNSWFATKTRSPFMSYDICVGSAVGNANVGWLIIPAAEALVVEADAPESTARKSK